MYQIFTILMISTVFFWQTYDKKTNEVPSQEIKEMLVVESQVKSSDSKTTVEFMFGTPIYWGEKGVLIERGTSPIEIKNGTCDDKELIPFKVNETTKYKVEFGKEINLEKNFKMLVSDKNSVEFQGEIKLNQPQHLEK